MSTSETLKQATEAATTYAHTLGYIAFFQGKRYELYATNMFEAKDLAIAHFKPAKNKQHLVSVHLAEKDGQEVVHTPDF